MARTGRPRVGRLRDIRLADDDWDALGIAAATLNERARELDPANKGKRLQLDRAALIRQLVAEYLHRGPAPERLTEAELTEALGQPGAAAAG
jgi:hypothetical protein